MHTQNVLLVETDPSVIQLLVRLMMPHVERLDVVDNVGAILDAFRRNMYDIVICGIVQPNVSPDLMLAGHLREYLIDDISALPNVPFCFILPIYENSGAWLEFAPPFGDIRDRDFVVTNPFDTDELLYWIQKQIKAQ
jgi:CheY-like chemotaxis protein